MALIDGEEQYAYFTTEEYPYVLRNFRGSFEDDDDSYEDELTIYKN